MEKEKKKKRFETVYGGAFSATHIIVDTETGVNYLFHTSGYAGGLTPLLDREGNVVITPIVK